MDDPSLRRLTEFCKKLELPWNSSRWGFKEGSKDFELLLPSKVPNDGIRKVRGLADWGIKSCGFDVDLPLNFSFDDVAKAIRRVSICQGAGDRYCYVSDATISKVDPTVLEVTFIGKFHPDAYDDGLAQGWLEPDRTSKLAPTPSDKLYCFGVRGVDYEECYCWDELRSNY